MKATIVRHGSAGMYEFESELIKHRKIRFCPRYADPDQAAAAMRALSGLSGIEAVRRTARDCVEVVYDLRSTSLRSIENALGKLGFRLDGGLLSRLKRALFHYVDETQRANLGHHHDPNSTREVFVNRYQHQPHGCRDDRPRHWREYL